MSLIRRCDICNRDIEYCVEFKHINTCVSAGPEYKDNKEDGTLDICPSCWTLLMHDIRVKQQRREEAKEADKIFTDPWDPGMMVVQRRD